MNAYDFSLPALAGGTLDLREFEGRPLLIANTASRCGFTSQYAGLQKLWETYRDRGLVVLGVPSNDFGGQEPGNEAAIGAFCQKNYGVTFPLSAKRHVRGPETDPLFRYLGDSSGFLARPRWNFFKYVVRADGTVSTWFSSVTRPDSAKVVAAIEQILVK